VEHWSTKSDWEIWNRKGFTGFTTIPRTLSLITRTINDLDSKNAGNVYVDLWCRAFDDSLIEVRDEHEVAFASGYDGKRAVRSWRERIEVLETLGFIKLHKGPTGNYRHILLLDPHPVIETLNSQGKLPEALYLPIKTMLIQIGALDEAKNAFIHPLAPFTRETIERLDPKVTGVYGLFRGDVCIYVGSGNLRTRLLAHLNGDLPGSTAAPPDKVTVEVTAQYVERERALVERLKPIANKHQAIRRIDHPRVSQAERLT
jgi:hypothetical protein